MNSIIKKALFIVSLCGITSGFSLYAMDEVTITQDVSTVNMPTNQEGTAQQMHLSSYFTELLQGASFYTNATLEEWLAYIDRKQVEAEQAI